MSVRTLSIIIPTLNRPIQLSWLVDKILDFANPEVEVIVVDDSVVRWNYIDENSDLSCQVVYLHRAKRLGVSSARNIGAQHAKGKYLIFLDDDDDFSPTWISDFCARVAEGNGLVYCNMRLVEPNGKVSSVSAFKNKRGIVIPGAWMISREVFDRVGGYDERLKFAENTELFFRLNQLSLKIEYIEKENFIYRQSPDGGSKNLQNMLDSLRIILEKHDSYLSPYVKHLYHQNIGVIEMRFGRFQVARTHLWKSWTFKPQKISTLARIALAYFPLVARRVYTLEITS